MDFRKVNWWRWQLPELAGKPLPLVYGTVGQPLPPISDGFVYVQHEGTLEEAIDSASLNALIAEAKAQTALIIEALENVRREIASLKRAA